MSFDFDVVTGPIPAPRGKSEGSAQPPGRPVQAPDGEAERGERSQGAAVKGLPGRR